MLTGDNLTYVQLVLYAAIVLTHAWEGNLGKFLYFLGACILTVGVLKMKG
jgi:hypothetical protein